MLRGSPPDVAPTRNAAADDDSNVPDLLHPTPLRRVDFEQTKLAIALAFAGGVSGGLFSDAIEQATLAPSTWDPASFENDLFLQSFIALCLKVRIGSEDHAVSTTHLARLLSHPPTDVAVVHYRRRIVAELAESATLRAALERLYTSVCRFRTLLEGAAGFGKWDANRRRLDILATFKAIVDAMTADFAEATSGLGRLARFGARVKEGEPYRSLADLLRYDDRLATLSLEVSVGADGRLRGFHLLSVREDADNPFVTTPWRRWLGKLELFVRGFRFGDGEVMARLIDAVFDGIEDELVPLVQLLGDLEFYLGALGFRDAARAAGLDVCLPDLVPPTAPRALFGLYNPLLLAHGVSPVPCDIAIDRLAATVLVTGPNSGGKTRLLQSLGFAQLLAQSGLFIPARAGQVALAPALVVSLVEETKADQSEGRLGTELIRIRALFERLPPGGVVIVDELCSGTNPSEGEEIFELVVRMLTRLEPQAFITTHFLAFAASLAKKDEIVGLRFLQVELGAGHAPTYQFSPGVARTSLAAHAAERLGVTGEQLSALVEQSILRARAGRR